MENRAAIIGGGPAGLTQARALGDLGIPYTIFERNAAFGGLWNTDDPTSPIYDSAHLISSRYLTGFQDYPMPDDWADYPSRVHILEYIQSFAKDHGIAAHARFNAEVSAATPVEGGWEVATKDGTREKFRWLIAANGSNWKPVMPKWPGTFDGTLRHAASYKSPEEFADKKVLIVGLGNSGVDIACDAVRSAKSVDVSIRRGYHVIPKHIFGKPADVFSADSPGLPFPIRQRILQKLLRVLIGDLGKYGMPKPDHRLMETHPLLNDQFIFHLRHGDLDLLADIERLEGQMVHFKDGTSGEYDEIICATGFDWEIPYIKEELLPWERGRIAPPLAIFPDVENLFLISFVESNGSSFSLFNDMSRIIARAILIERDKPQEYQRLRKVLKETEFDVTGGLRMLNTDRHVGYMDNLAYRKALKKLIKMMSWPDEGRPLKPKHGWTSS